MKKLLLQLVVITTLISCGGTQKTTSYIQTGNYTEAFNNSIAKLNKNKTSKANQKHIPLLKEAYIKAAESDLQKITSLKRNNTSESLKKAYGTYLNLDLRQDEVKVLQPLFFEGNQVDFVFKDYTNDILASKNSYSTSLYTAALKEMKGDKLAARKAYKLFEELIYVNPTYKNNLTEISQNSKNKGSSFVLVTLKNNVRSISNDSIIDVAKINSGNFDNQWVAYHNKRNRRIKYDYQVAINFDKLSFVPEKTQQQAVPQEAKVQDGFQYQLDGNGNVLKDDKGNDMKVAKYKIVKAQVDLYQQNKASKLDGTVTIKNLKTKATVSTNPLFGEAKFQHTYGKYRGDQRAIEQKYYDALKVKELPYPKDYEFVKYSILNFKQKVTALLSQQQF